MMIAMREKKGEEYEGKVEVGRQSKGMEETEKPQIDV
jgi:hypothetical protein